MTGENLSGSGSQQVLIVDDLSVIARDRKRKITSIVTNISFSIERGKVIALIGESGSGKTTISLACMGYARAGCNISQGAIKLDDQDILQLSTVDRRNLRGRDVAYIAQSAAAAFNSTMTLLKQVTETPVIKGLMTQSQANKKAIALFRELDLPDADTIGNRYPHQVSGGQLQRVMAAMAMICDPKLLILDEPTTALDVTTQIEVLRSFKKLIRDRHTSAIYVSHDLAVVAQIADEVLVLKNGLVVEKGSIQQIIESPQHEYTRELISAAHVMPKVLPVARSLQSSAVGSENIELPLLRVNSVTAGYGKKHRYLALHEVSIQAIESRTIGIIGESGSGKTTLGRVISGLMPIKTGHIDFLGEQLDDSIEQRDREQQRSIQFAFQMADVALNPRHTVKKILGRPLSFYFNLDKRAIDQRVSELLELVELPEQYSQRYPRQLSGGERQRVNLARALAAEPKLIICDEITSALDTIVAKSILRLLKELQDRLGVAYIFISHDLSTIARIADTIAVMREGKIVEQGSTMDIMTPPHHPYTELLLNSVPELDPRWLQKLKLTDSDSGCKN